MGTVAPGVL
jgi:hypothetical protein